MFWQHNWWSCMYAIMYWVFDFLLVIQKILTQFWSWPDCKQNFSHDSEGITCLTLLLMFLALYSLSFWFVNGREFLCSNHMVVLTYHQLATLKHSMMLNLKCSLIKLRVTSMLNIWNYGSELYEWYAAIEKKELYKWNHFLLYSNYYVQVAFVCTCVTVSLEFNALSMWQGSCHGFGSCKALG